MRERGREMEKTTGKLYTRDFVYARNACNIYNVIRISKIMPILFGNIQNPNWHFAIADWFIEAFINFYANLYFFQIVAELYYKRISFNK